MTELCGRPTGASKSGRPCRREPLEGMRACVHHATDLDYAYREGFVAGVKAGRAMEAKWSGATIERLTESRDEAIKLLNDYRSGQWGPGRASGIE